MPHFRGVLLPPGNRSDESILWSWTEPPEAPEASGAELTTIRKRLLGAQESLVDSLDDADAGPAAKAATASGLVQRMDDLVNALVALPDGALAGYVARTERGLLLHSWGLRSPLSVQHPDVDLEVNGRVLVDGVPRGGIEMRLETGEGANVALTESDREGKFQFTQLAPKDYRVRAVSGSPAIVFPARGQPAEFHGSSTAHVEISGQSVVASALRGEGVSAPGRGVRRAAAMIVLLLVAGGGGYGWLRKSRAESLSATDDLSRWKVNSAPRGVAERGAAAPPDSRSQEAGAAAGVGDSSIPSSRKQPARNDPMPPVIETEAEDHGPSAEARRRASQGLVMTHPAAGGPTRAGGGAAAAGGMGGGFAGEGSTPGAAVQPGVSPAAASAPAETVGSAQAGGPAGQAPAVGAETGASSESPTGDVAGAETPPLARDSRRPPTPNTTPPPAGESAVPSPEAALTATPAASDNSEKSRKGEGADDARPEREAERARADSPKSTPANEETANRGAPDSARAEEDIDDDKAERSARVPHDPAPSTASESEPSIANRVSSENGEAMALDAALAVETIFRGGAWQRRLLRDAIVPTLPVPRGKTEDWNELGARMLGEKQAALPPALRDARLVVGVRVEVAGGRHLRALRWTRLSGDEPQGLYISEGAAEIVWREGVAAGEFALVGASGATVARVYADPRRGIRVESAEAASSWPWIGIECASPEEAAQLRWEILGAAARPTTWTEANGWSGVHGKRVDLRLPASKDDTVALTVAVVDAASGWALTSKLEQQQKRR